jgi:hypothetical protein
MFAKLFVQSIALVQKANPYHDHLGRFARKDGAKFVSIGGVFDKQREKASAKSVVKITVDSYLKPGGLAEQVLELKNGIWQAENGGLSNKQDALLAHIAKARGFDGKPKVVSRAKLDDAIRSGDHELVRGFADTFNADGSQFIEQFKTGEAYQGLGIHGNGTYTQGFITQKAKAARGGDLEAHRAEAERKLDHIQTNFAAMSESSMARMALSKDAKIVKIGDLREEWLQDSDAREPKSTVARLKERGKAAGYSSLTDIPEALGDKWYNEEKANYDREKQDYQKFEAVTKDLGRYAALKGYDAIHVKNEDYVVVLNRTKLLVQDEQFKRSDVLGV